MDRRDLLKLLGVGNLGRISLASDMVFGDDGGVHEPAAVRGNIDDGYLMTLTVPVEV